MTRDVAHADPLTEPLASVPAKSRLLIIDKLRGLVIVLMILDHTRHFFHDQALLFSPTDLSKTTAAIFATRWITHLCAPTFVFLSGAAVFLQRENGKRGWPLTHFLLTRGLWLIALELSVVSFAFNFAEPFFLFQVIWAIGFSFILLAAFTALPPRLVLLVGIAIVAGHNLLDTVPVPAAEPWRLLWTLMLKPGRIGAMHGFVAYPALPWFGIMAFGYGTGFLFREAPERRNRMLVAMGLAMLAIFAVLRGFNVYGDPSSWRPGSDMARSIMSFMNVTKYPPSLLYALVTLGIVLTLAPLVAKVAGPPGRLLHTFGRTPLFVYLVHLYVVHGLALVAGIAAGLSSGLFTFTGSTRLAAAGWGVGLGGVYLIWLAVVLTLWPLATWFAGVKDRRRFWWLSYI